MGDGAPFASVFMSFILKRSGYRMPERVATIVGLRGMFRSVGGVMSICFVTSILHLSSGPVAGFRITFFSFGFLLAFGIPLAFLVPSGR